MKRTLLYISPVLVSDSSFEGAQVYLSGAISNRDPQEVERLFGHAYRVFTDAGAHVINPLNNGLDHGATWQDHMRADIKMMMGADIVVLLPGWEASRGATIEKELALSLGIAVLDLYTGQKLY